MKVSVIVFPGTNCDRDTKWAFEKIGAKVEFIWHNEKDLKNPDLVVLPGGFSYGDYLRSGALAKFAPIMEAIKQYTSNGGKVLGICNGFQLMVKLGLLPALDSSYEKQVVTLTYNDSGRFEDRWVYLYVDHNSPCVFTKGIEKLYLPIRHGEGKFIPKDKTVLEAIEEAHLGVVKYMHPETGCPTLDYPFNPNGSVNAIAGLCDPSGRIFGLMPHPEGFLHFTHHPRWTRENLPEEGMGLALFLNAVDYIKQNVL